HVRRAAGGAHVRERAVPREAECTDDSVPVDLLWARVPHRAGPGPPVDRRDQPAPFLRATSLESRSPAGIRPQVGSMTTTPTLTGPASAPRPTSSMPATSV